MRIRVLNSFMQPEMVAAITDAYREAFGGEPWNEGYLCPICGLIVSLGTGFRICPDCAGESQRVLLVEYWAASKVISDFYNEMRKPGAMCLVSEKDGAVIGFAWGYQIVVSPELAEHLEALGLDERVQGSFFYLDECAVVPAYQGRGIGRLIVRRVFAEKQRILLRTLNGSRMFRIVSHLGGEIIQYISRERVIMKLIAP